MEAAGVFEPGGPVAAGMTTLMWILIGLGGLVAVLFLYLLVRGLVRRPTVPLADDLLWRRWLIGAGMVMPALVIAVVFGSTLATMRDTDLAPGTYEIEVIGHQWWWEVRYPGFVTANEIHIPVGEPVTFALRSADVIHSFWVPELGGKIDLLPDHPNSVTLQADAPGVYGGACAEFCGLQHARMRLRVQAQTPEEFAAWAAAQQLPPAEPATAAIERGRELFVAEECGECHRVAGLTPGTEAPDLTHLASRATLAAATLPNDTAHLTDWLTRPQSLKEGTAMPGTELTGDALDDLVAYLESLR